MNSEQTLSFSVVLINVIILLAAQLIVEEEHPKPAINAFKLGILMNAVSWVFFIPQQIPLLLIGSYFATAIYMWCIVVFARRRAKDFRIRLPVALCTLQCLAYLWFNLKGNQAGNLVVSAVAGSLVAVLVCRNFLFRKKDRTTSDLYFAGIYAMFLVIYLGRALLMAIFPDFDQASDIAQYFTGPALYLGSGIFALMSYMEEAQGRLRHQAIRDPLTGLLNRRGLHEMLTPILSQTSRSSQPMTLIAADIDHFKKINDTYGHEIGDAVLEALGSRFNREVRGQDLVSRHGGEEFVILLPNTELKTGVAIAERLRRAAAEVVVEGPTGPIRMTVSFGVASLPGGHAFDPLFRLADTALYRAKSQGRDRVEAEEGAVIPTPAASARA